MSRDHDVIFTNPRRVWHRWKERLMLSSMIYWSPVTIFRLDCDLETMMFSHRWLCKTCCGLYWEGQEELGKSYSWTLMRLGRVFRMTPRMLRATIRRLFFTKKLLSALGRCMECMGFCSNTHAHWRAIICWTLLDIKLVPFEKACQGGAKLFPDNVQQTCAEQGLAVNSVFAH